MSRRPFLAAAGFLLLLRSAVAGVAAVAGVTITVADAERASAFYVEVLGFRRVAEVERAGADLDALHGVFGARVKSVELALGAESVELVEFVAPGSRPFPVDSRGNDRWFQHVAIVVRDMERAFLRLREHGVRLTSPAPQRLPDWNPAAGGIEACYFRDPDGHWLELIRFPAGKGDPRWQTPGDELFQGIDHTAIVVANTERALEFYRDRLGLAVAGHSENFGPEQERLNGVFGARLRITGLAAPGGGPGVELLEYLAPSPGREAPADFGATDLAHWWTRFRADAAFLAEVSARPAPGRRVAAGVVAIPAAGPRAVSATTLRDADSHGVLLQAEVTR